MSESAFHAAIYGIGMEYHRVVQKIRDLLEKNNITYKFFAHDTVRTSEEAAALRPDYTLRQGAKALILQVTDFNGEKKFVMAIMPADRKLDAKKLKTSRGLKKVRFATKEEADEITNGVEFGGVPPFGNIFGLDVIIDPTLFENKDIIFNCGDRRASIALRSEDYAQLVPHRVHDIV